MKNRLLLTLLLVCTSTPLLAAPAGFCSTGMMGHKKPFVISRTATEYSFQTSKQTLEFEDTKRIFIDYIRREYEYVTYEANCHMYAEKATAEKERDRWIEYWKNKGRDIVLCDC